MKRGAQSGLIGWSGTVPNIGRVELVRPARATLIELDSIWSALRPSDAVSTPWSWALVARDADLFLIRAAGTHHGLAIWRSKRPMTVLRGARYYRLDNLEVAPTAQSRGLGSLLLALAATRACELGCSGIVLAAPEELVGWYARAGAQDALSLGWTYSPGMSPLVFEGAEFAKLKEVADDLRTSKAR